VTPNLSTFEAISRQWGKPEVLSRFLQDQRAHLMTPAMRLDWQDMDYVRRTGNLDAQWAFLRIFTRALSDAGVPLLTGTDSPVIPGMYPGYSIHDDLRTLVEAGLSPYEALRAATRTPGEFIAQSVPGSERFGMVKVGMRADLVLVEHDPFEGLETLRSPLGVMGGGRWRSRDELSALLASRKARYDALLR
jgi:predicted amidohydrolase YtcJ